MKYPGAKWGIARWIIGFFPEHHSYLEPFLGSGAVLLNKPRSNIETVNDLDGDVVNLFKWIREDPEKLAYQVYFTPYSRQAYEDAFTGDTGSSLQKAVNFYIRLNQGHGFRTTGERVGWKNDVQGRERSYASMEWCSIPERILQAAERLRGVQIECMPAVDLMQRFNHKKVLVYLDPPYFPGTRHGKQYRHEMYSIGSHEELLVAARRHKGPLLISGYESELYTDMLGGWHKECIRTRSQAGSEKTETLWMNFDPYGRQMDISECFGEYWGRYHPERVNIYHRFWDYNACRALCPAGKGGGQCLMYKKRKAAKTKGIVTEYTGICFFCGSPAEGEHHLLFGNGRREYAEQDGLKVPACNKCHNSGDRLGRIHGNPMAERMSKMLGQAFYEQKIGTREEFRARYGKSYL